MRPLLLAFWAEPISLGQLVAILFIVASLAGLSMLALRAVKAGDPTCPWHQRLYSWGKRHVPLLIAIGGLSLLLFGPIIAKQLTFWAYDAHPILPTQENLDSDQEAATRQAGGNKPLGAILSIFSGGTFLFSLILVVVWFVLHYIVPAGPVWAKKYYSLGFKNPSDEGYAMGPNLSTFEQYQVYNKVWLSLCFLYAFCIYIVAVSG